MKYLFSLLLLLMALPSQAEIVSRNLVGKAADISLTANYQETTGTGDIQVQLCPTCNKYKLTITPETKISKDDKILDLSQFKMHLKANGKAPMRLQFHKETKRVFYIHLQRKNQEYIQ